MENYVSSVKSKDDFTRFIDILVQDLQENPASWENKTLNDFLRAIQSWTEDMEGYYINNGLPIPENVDWRTFARILTAAKMYE